MSCHHLDGKRLKWLSNAKYHQEIGQSRGRCMPCVCARTVSALEKNGWYGGPQPSVPWALDSRTTEKSHSLNAQGNDSTSSEKALSTSLLFFPPWATPFLREVPGRYCRVSPLGAWPKCFLPNQPSEDLWMPPEPFRSQGATSVLFG